MRLRRVSVTGGGDDERGRWAGIETNDSLTPGADESDGTAVMG